MLGFWNDGGMYRVSDSEIDQQLEYLTGCRCPQEEVTAVVGEVSDWLETHQIVAAETDQASVEGGKPRWVRVGRDHHI